MQITIARAYNIAMAILVPMLINICTLLDHMPWISPVFVIHSKSISDCSIRELDPLYGTN